MKAERQRRLEGRSRRVEKVLRLFRDAVPPGELETNDWESIRVAVRIVYETEELRVSLRPAGSTSRGSAISYWSDSVESGLAFMSWTRELSAIAKGRNYSKPILDLTLEGLWQRHHRSALRLGLLRLTPARRLSLLAELGGIELCLLGRLWVA